MIYFKVLGRKALRKVVKMIRYYNEIWLEKKQDALYDALEEIENILNYDTKDVPYDDDFEDEIKFIKDNIGYLETLEKEIEEFLKSEEFDDESVDSCLNNIQETLWIDENNIPYDTMFGYRMGFITRKQKEIKRVLRNLQGVLDDYDRDEPWHTGMI